MTKEEASKLIRQQNGGSTFKIRVQPNSAKNSIQGLYGDSLKILLTAPPVEGKANKELIKFFSKNFAVSKSSIQIIAGLKSRNKTVVIKGTDPKYLLEKLSEKCFLQ